MRLFRWAAGAGFVVLLVPGVAAASVAKSAPTLVLPWQQVWPLLIGAMVPLVTYAVNHVGPWMSEQVKAAVVVVAAAATSALYTALATNVIGFNSATLQLVLTGVVGALGAHHWLWKPAGVSALLGGGTNAQQAARSSSVRTTPAARGQAPVVPVSPDAAQVDPPARGPGGLPPKA